MKRVLVATSNPGKVRDLIGAAAVHNVSIETLPGLAALPAVIEDGTTFEANARKKAEHYSKYVEGDLVIADDSGLEVDALKGSAWRTLGALCRGRKAAEPWTAK